MYDYLIVGAGFAGSVLAERLASSKGQKVLLIDKRDHIGGNAYDYYDTAGILVHKYGPHIFHTNSPEVFKYLSKFTEWRSYRHKVLACVNEMLLPIPINLNTVNSLYNLNLTSLELESYFDEVKEKLSMIKNSEDAVVSQVGRDLYEKFFKGYTRKQWGLDPAELDKSVTSRIPTRTSTDDHYFSDEYQYMPLLGYTRLFENMLSHPNITVRLDTSIKEVKQEVAYRNIIYTGPIDEYFDYCYGKLPYRSLSFRHETLRVEQYQPVAVVNYPNAHDYTRITEYKHLTGQLHPHTSITYEFPSWEGDPYYPVPNPANAEVYARYRRLAEGLQNVYFVGRLGSYRYYNMDQVVAQSLTLFKKIAERAPAQVLA